MKAKRVSASLEEPGAREWDEVPSEKLELAATPVAKQPSAYVRTVWADRPYGLVHDLKAQATHDGETLYLRLEWAGPTGEAIASGDGSTPHPIEGPDAFPDALAVMFPLNGEAQLETMGSDEAPVALWRWSAGTPTAAEELTSTGIGTVRPADGSGGLSARASEDDGSRQLVLARPLQAAKGKSLPGFTPGGETRVAFAVWAGVNQERGGIKSASPSWIELALEE